MIRSHDWSKLGGLGFFLALSALSFWGGLKRELGYPFSGGRGMPPRMARIVGFILAFFFVLLALLTFLA